MGPKFTVIFYGPKETHGAQELDREVAEGATSLGGAPYPLGVPLACGAPSRPLAPSFCYMKPFALEKK